MEKLISQVVWIVAKTYPISRQYFDNTKLIYNMLSSLYYRMSYNSIQNEHRFKSFVYPSNPGDLEMISRMLFNGELDERINKVREIIQQRFINNDDKEHKRNIFNHPIVEFYHRNKRSGKRVTIPKSLKHIRCGHATIKPKDERDKKILNILRYQKQ